MNDEEIHLTEIRAQLNVALLQLDRLVAGSVEGVTAEEREAITNAVRAIRSYRPQSMRNALAFWRAVREGDEAWLLLRSVPGEQRVDAWCHARLRRHEVRRLTDGE